MQLVRGVGVLGKDLAVFRLQEVVASHAQRLINGAHVVHTPRLAQRFHELLHARALINTH